MDYEIIYDFIYGDNLKNDLDNSLEIDKKFDESKLIGYFTIPLIIDIAFSMLDENISNAIKETNENKLKKNKIYFKKLNKIICIIFTFF